AFFCAMPTLLRNSALLGAAASVVCLPIVAFNLVRLLRRQAIDVINCHYLAEAFIHLVLAGRLLGIETVISVHGADVDRYAKASAGQRLLLRLVMRGADRIVACSDAMARQTAEVFPFATRKITHVHNGLTLSDLPADPGVPPIDSPFLLMVARQVPKK